MLSHEVASKLTSEKYGQILSCLSQSIIIEHSVKIKTAQPSTIELYNIIRPLLNQKFWGMRLLLRKHVNETSGSVFRWERLSLPE